MHSFYFKKNSLTAGDMFGTSKKNTQLKNKSLSSEVKNVVLEKQKII